MKKLLLAGVAALAIAAGAVRPAMADAQHGTEQEAVAMVKRAIAEIKKHGRDKAFARFDDKKDKAFHDRDLYIFVDRMDGVVLAHGENPRIIGVNLLDAKDANGKKYNRERIEMIRKKGKGWANYMYFNPRTARIEPKRAYIEGYEDLFVGCGVYESASE